MYRRTTNLVIGQTLLDALLGCLAARPAAALLTTPKLQLFVGNTTVTPLSAWADFTFATFHGYADAAVTLTAPGNLANGDQCVTSAVNYIATTGGSLGAQNIAGYILSDGAAAFYAGERFDVPVSIAAVGDFLDLDFILPLLVRPPFTT